jgi:hypothetical protein
MKRAWLILLLLALSIVGASGVAHATISAPSLRPPRPAPSDPSSSLVVLSDLHVADHGEADVFVAVMPLGMTADGLYVDLVIVVEPETHTREIWLVQSPLGLWVLREEGNKYYAVANRKGDVLWNLAKILYGSGAKWRKLSNTDKVKIGDGDDTPKGNQLREISI